MLEILQARLQQHMNQELPDVQTGFRKGRGPRDQIANIYWINKKVQNAGLGCSLKKDRLIYVHFQGKPFTITVIQVYAPTSNTEEAEVEWFYEDL